MKKLLLIAVSAIALFSCCGDKKGLADTSWLLVEMNGEKIDRESLENKESYTLNFEMDSVGMRVYGLADGNRYFGMPTVNEKDKSIVMGEMGVTRMMSPNQEREDKYLKVLNETDKYKMSCGELTLLKGEETLAKFTTNKDKCSAK